MSRAVYSASGRVGVWPSALAVSAISTFATNIAVVIVMWTLSLPGYAERPANGALLFLVPFFVSLPVALIVFSALDRARRAEARALENEAKFRDLAE